MTTTKHVMTTSTCWRSSLFHRRTFISATSHLQLATTTNSNTNVDDPSPVVRRFKLGVQYVGSRYGGFSSQLHNLQHQLLQSQATSSSSAMPTIAQLATIQPIDLLNFVNQQALSTTSLLKALEQDDNHTPTTTTFQVGVQDIITTALHQFTKHHHGFSHVKASSRTDAGVHALRNVFQVDLHHSSYTCDGIQRGLNFYLLSHLSEIFITDVEEVPLTFDARIDATSRTYLYKTLLLPTISDDKLALITSKTALSSYKLMSASKYTLFNQHRHWLVDPIYKRGRDYRFDLHALIEGCRHLVGELDFASFRNAKCQSTSSFREIYFIEVYCNHVKVATVSKEEGKPHIEYHHHDPNGLLKPTKSTTSRLEQIRLLEDDVNSIDIIIKGDSFLLRMVRNMMAVLVQVGQGSLQASDVDRIMQLKDRGKVKIPPAPAQGLYLIDVEYDAVLRATKEERIKSRPIYVKSNITS